MHEPILAIDYGRVRHGLAVSDGLGLAGHPLPALQRSGAQADLARLEQLVAERGIRRIVLGLPLNADGSEGSMAREVRRFGAWLSESLDLQLDYEDERLTTDEAEARLQQGGLRPSQRRRRRDSVAAAIILQAVLDREGRGPAG